MKANAKQKQLIHLNAKPAYIKEEYVQWATGDEKKTSCNDLSFDQANTILKQMGMQPIAASKEDSALFWAYFDKKNSKHMQIMSLLHQVLWRKRHPKYGMVPDLERFGSWLQSDKSPVQKPLKKMTPQECSKIITALEGILKNLYK